MSATVGALRAAGACFAFVHGSGEAGTHRRDFDVDVAAWFDGHDPALWTIGGLPVGGDLLVLDRAPLELAGRVALHGVLPLDDNPVARVRWLALTRKIYLDEKPRTDLARRIFFEGVGAREAAQGRR